MPAPSKSNHTAAAAISNNSGRQLQRVNFAAGSGVTFKLMCCYTGYTATSVTTRFVYLYYPQASASPRGPLVNVVKVQGPAPSLVVNKHWYIRSGQQAKLLLQQHFMSTSSTTITAAVKLPGHQQQQGSRHPCRQLVQQRGQPLHFPCHQHPPHLEAWHPLALLLQQQLAELPRQQQHLHAAGGL